MRILENNYYCNDKVIRKSLRWSRTDATERSKCAVVVRTRIIVTVLLLLIGRDDDVIAPPNTVRPVCFQNRRHVTRRSITVTLRLTRRSD